MARKKKGRRSGVLRLNQGGSSFGRYSSFSLNQPGGSFLSGRPAGGSPSTGGPASGSSGLFSALASAYAPGSQSPPVQAPSEPAAPAAPAAPAPSTPASPSFPSFPSGPTSPALPSLPSQPSNPVIPSYPSQSYPTSSLASQVSGFVNPSQSYPTSSLASQVSGFVSFPSLLQAILTPKAPRVGYY